MPKIKTKWICQNCGYETPKSLGKCPECSSWGSFVEEAYDTSRTAVSSNAAAFSDSAPCLINEITIENTIRFSSGIEEFASPSGEIETGHSGNGAISITCIVIHSPLTFICFCGRISITGKTQSTKTRSKFKFFIYIFPNKF